MSDSNTGLISSPFWLRRPALLLEGARVKRDQPDFARLRSLRPSERFVWGILPHAARSFAPCIISLPTQIALPMAVGYLYCRILDTYEDLLPDADARQAALRGLPARLELLQRGDKVDSPSSQSYQCQDSRDEAHALLANEVQRLDVLFCGFSTPIQAAISDLVLDMSEGMRWASDVFDAQAGSLSGGGQLSRYCTAVLGNPIRFAARLFQWHSGRGVDLHPDVESASCDVGEFLQLANITRDIEKDLLRGVCYHKELSALAERRHAGDTDLIRSVRAAFCDRALSLSPAYLALVDGMRLPSGLMSSSALMMLRFTEQHYRRTADRVGVTGQHVSGIRSAIWRSLPAVISGRWARAQMERAVLDMKELREALPTQASSMYLS